MCSVSIAEVQRAQPVSLDDFDGVLVEPYSSIPSRVGAPEYIEAVQLMATGSNFVAPYFRAIFSWIRILFHVVDRIERMLQCCHGYEFLSTQIFLCAYVLMHILLSQCFKCLSSLASASSQTPLQAIYTRWRQREASHTYLWGPQMYRACSTIPSCPPGTTPTSRWPPLDARPPRIGSY